MIYCVQEVGSRILEKCGNCPMAIAVISDVLFRESEHNPGPDGWAAVLEGWNVCIASECNPDDRASTQAETVQGAIRLSLDRLPTVRFASCQLH